MEEQICMCLTSLVTSNGGEEWHGKAYDIFGAYCQRCWKWIGTIDSARRGSHRHDRPGKPHPNILYTER